MRIGLLIGLLITAAAAHGADWTFTSADFQKQSVTLRSLDDNGLMVVTQGGTEPIRIPLDQFLAINRDQPPSIAPGALVLHLAGGGRLVGSPVRIDGDNIFWQTRSIGEVPASLRQVRGITRGPQPLAPVGDLPRDRVRLANGDQLEGIVADVTEDGLIIQVDGGAVPVPLDSIVDLHFAVTGGEARDDQSGFQLRLADGSTVAAQTVRITGNEAEVAIAGEVRRIGLAGVMAIEQVNGPIVWLSDRPPVEVQNTPFLGDPVLPRFNINLDGRPVRIGSDRISKLVAVHSRSQLTWDLPDDYHRFRTQYAIDGDLPHANVTVRIRLDDRIVHEQEDVVAGAVSPVIELDLDGARQITLEADYGRTYDVQDRLIWIEPALMKQP